MKWVYRAAVACLALSLFLGLVLGLRASAGLVATPRAVASARLGVPRSDSLGGVSVRRVEADLSEQPVELGSIERGLLFVYDPLCRPCNLNVWNWLDLLSDLRTERITFAAITIGTPAEAMGYWSSRPGHLDLLLADTTVMLEDIGTAITPTTLVVERGVITREYRGPLTSHAKEEIVSILATR